MVQGIKGAGQGAAGQGENGKGMTGQGKAGRLEMEHCRADLSGTGRDESG